MTAPALITSLQNPRVKQVVALRDRRSRERSGLMRVEGFEELSLALASGAPPRELFFCPALFRAAEQQKLAEEVCAAGGELIEVSEPVFRKMAYREGPDGWLATFPTPGCELAELPLSQQPFVVVAEALEKPGNLGAILRTADAAGVDALVAAAARTDWGNPNVVRASKGALFTVPVAQASTEQTIRWLRRHALRIVVATPQAAQSYTDTDLRGAVAIVVGAEKQGVSRNWLEPADALVRIPMFGRVNSLNVSIATALLVYEVVRQRQS